MNSYEILIDAENRLVKVVAVGQLLQADGEKIISQARAEAMKNGYNILYDIRKATTKVELADWFHLPRKLQVFKDVKARQIIAAIIASKYDKDVSE